MNSFHILLVEPYRMIREMFSKALESLIDTSGSIIQTSAMEECREILKKQKFDLIVIGPDINFDHFDSVKRSEPMIYLSIKAPLQKKRLGQNNRIKEIWIGDSMEHFLHTVRGMLQKDGVASTLEEPSLAEAHKEVIPLSKREIEVLKLLTMGKLNKEIAYELSISEKTVKNHITNIFKKLEIGDRTQAAVYAIKHHIVII